MIFYLFQTNLHKLQYLHTYYLINVDYREIMKKMLKRFT